MKTGTQALLPASTPKPSRGSNKASLEAELSETLRRVESLRDRRLVARHLGWDGKLPCSLKEAGDMFHLTRERARQVYARALPLLRQSKKLPALDAVLALVRKHQNEQVLDVQRILRQHGLTNGNISLQGILRAAQVFDRDPGFQLHEIGGVVFVGACSELASVILTTAAKRVAHHGAAQLSGLHGEVSKGIGRDVEKRLVRQILETRPDISWLDDGEWFWLTSVPRNRLLARVRKVLAMHPRIGVSKLHEAISRGHRPLRIPESTLRSLCHGLSWCRVRGRHVEARVVQKMDDVLTGGEATICRTLRDHGGTLGLQELEELCFAAGVTRPNLWRVLSFSPLIRRFDKQMYGLVGAEVSRSQSV